MTRQSTTPLRNYRFQPSARNANEIAGTMFRMLDLNPPYQRGSVWTEDQRIALVKSWLMGVSIPAILLNDRSTPEWKAASGDPFDQKVDGEWLLWAVVDGKQRVETARRWFQGELFVPASWFRPDLVELVTPTEDGPYTSYDRLTIVGQRYCNRDFQLPVIESRVPTVEAEAEMYLLVNGGGTAQTEADMANAAKVAGR